MRKSPLRDCVVLSDAACVDDAAACARRLTQFEARGPGDLEPAWRRLEHRYSIPWRAFWRLRYRAPRSITAALYANLSSAYQAECERQQRKLAHEAATARALGVALDRSTESLVGEPTTAGSNAQGVREDIS